MSANLDKTLSLKNKNMNNTNHLITIGPNVLVYWLLILMIGHMIRSLDDSCTFLKLESYGMSFTPKNYANVDFVDAHDT